MSRPILGASRLTASPAGLRSLRLSTTLPRIVTLCSDNRSSDTSNEGRTSTSTSTTQVSDVEKDIAKGIKQAATTFAPRPSTATKNPAYRGSMLFNVFEYQAWISMVVGGLLSYNVLFPTDEPSIPRLLGMWSIWMFTVPSLRARECMPKEKDALNMLFVAIPLMNVTLPLIWKSFPFIFTANAIAVFGVYYYKGVWKEVYGLPLEAPGSSSD